MLSSSPFKELEEAGPHPIFKTHALREELGKSQESRVLEPHPLWNYEHARADGVGQRTNSGPLGTLLFWLRKPWPQRSDLPKAPMLVITGDRARMRSWQALLALRRGSKGFEGKG